MTAASYAIFSSVICISLYNVVAVSNLISLQLFLLYVIMLPKTSLFLHFRLSEQPSLSLPYRSLFHFLCKRCKSGANCTDVQPKSLIFLTFLLYIHTMPWQTKSIFIILIISFHKPTNLDISGFLALFFNFVFCPKPTQFFIILRKFTGKWCSKWCSKSINFQPDFLCFPCVSFSLKLMIFAICSAARS